MAEPSPPSIEELRSLAQRVDAGEEVEINDAPANEAAADSPPEQEEKKGPSQDEIEKALEGEHDEESPKSSDITPEKSPLSKEDKEKERFDRNWKKLQRDREEVARKEEEVERQRRELEAQLAKQAKTRDLKDEQDEDGYSVKDYEYAKKKFEAEGEEALAKEAEDKAKALYFQGFQRVWKANMEELIDEFPDLSDSRKPITKAADKILNTLPFLKTIPDGCKYAVRIALGDTSSGMVSELQAENKKLKQEVEKLNKATRLSGSLPSRLPQGKTFDDLSSKERMAHLREMAEAVDRGDL